MAVNSNTSGVMGTLANKGKQLIVGAGLLAGIQMGTGVSNKIDGIMLGEAQAATLEGQNTFDIDGLNLGIKAKEELKAKIQELQTIGTDRIISLYDNETNQEIGVSYLNGQIEITVGNYEIKNDGGYKNYEQDKKNNLTISYDTDLEGNKITNYEQGGKKIEIKEIGNDAIITHIGFSGGHTEGDEDKLGQKESAKFSTNAMLSGKLTEYIALGGGVKIGPKQLAFLAFTGIDFNKYGQVYLSGEHYTENNTFNTTKGEKEAWVSQDKVSAMYSKKIGETLDRVNVKGSYTKGNDTEVFKNQSSTSSTTVTDTPESTITRTTTNIYETTGTSIGGTELQGAIETVWKLSENQKLTLGLQATDRKYNDGTDLGTSIGGIVGYEIVINELYKLRLGAQADDVQQRYTAGISRQLGDNGRIGLNTYYTNNEKGNDSYGAMVGYSHSFNTSGKTDTNQNKEKSKKSKIKTNYDDTNININALNFAQSEMSNGIDTPRKYKEETKLVSSTTTEDIKLKTKPVPPPEEPEPNPENPDINNNNYSVKTGEEITKYPLDDDTNIKGIDTVVSSTNGCEVSIVSGNGVKFKSNNEGTYTVVIKVIGNDNKKYDETLIFTVSEDPTVDKTSPVAKSDTFTTTPNTMIKGLDVLANDTDNSGVKPTLTGGLRNQVGGTFVVDNGKINFNPTNGFTGDASVEYEIQDGSKNKAWGKLQVTVSSGALTLPTSNFASGSITKTVGDGDFTNAFTTNSSGAITYTSNNTAVATVDSTGKIHIVGTGSATITASQAATATYSADTDNYSLTVNSVPPPNNAPTANITGTLEVPAGGTTTITCNGNDVDGDTLTYSWNTGATTQSITVGVGTYTCTVTDTHGATDTESVTVTEVAVNQAPTGENKTVDAGFINSSSVTVTLTDPDSGDTVEAIYVGSGVLGGDPVISSATASGNTINISVSSGVGDCYVDYKARDNHGVESTTTYRVTFNNLDGF